MTNRLVAFDLPGGDAFVDALQRAWDAGDAVLPVDRRLPATAKRGMMERMGAAAVITANGEARLDGGQPVEPGDALVMITSGTSGEPKGAVLTHAAVEASALATSHRLGVTGDDHWLACLPLSHVGGLSVVTRALLTHTRLTVHDGFDPTAVEQSGASLVSLVPTAMQRIDTHLFRWIVLGGARPPTDRPANTISTYGMTETGSGVVYDARPLDGVEVRVVDGEIQLRCPMLLRCYRDGTDPRTSDGWFPTGDLGRVEHANHTGSSESLNVTVDGRAGDLIVTGGENVWPEPVEAILRRLPTVADVAIAGVPDDEWGHAVTAFVVPVPGSDVPPLDALRDAVKAELPAFHAPKRLVVVGRIPCTALGKPRRSSLAASVETEAGLR